jgi:hypothetical protein
MKNFLRVITVALALGAAVQVIAENSVRDKSEQSSKSDKSDKGGAAADKADPGI